MEQKDSVIEASTDRDGSIPIIVCRLTARWVMGVPGKRGGAGRGANIGGGQVIPTVWGGLLLWVYLSK